MLTNNILAGRSREPIQKQEVKSHVLANCPYCHSFLSKKCRDTWDTILCETENFVAVPTKGALVPGWVLIVPKTHLLRFSDIAKDKVPELNKIVKMVSEKLSKKFGAVTIFEHGPLYEGSLLGCGVNHAHLHLVSLPFKMDKAISDFTDVEYDWMYLQSNDQYTHFDKSSAEYLMYQDGHEGVLRYAEVEEPVSQYFRKVVAHSVGLLDMYDYKKFAFDENVKRTIEAFSIS
jgi:ATP adenylyltransferase